MASGPCERAASSSAARSAELIHASGWPCVTGSPSLTSTSSTRPAMGGLISTRLRGVTTPVAVRVTSRSRRSTDTARRAAPLLERPINREPISNRTTTPAPMSTGRLRKRWGESQPLVGTGNLLEGRAFGGLPGRFPDQHVRQAVHVALLRISQLLLGDVEILERSQAAAVLLAHDVAALARRLKELAPHVHELARIAKRGPRAREAGDARIPRAARRLDRRAVILARAEDVLHVRAAGEQRHRDGDPNRSVIP